MTKDPYTFLMLLLLAGGLNLVYGVIFFTRLRPWLRRALSRRFGFPIRDGYDGAWTGELASSRRLGCLVSLLDFSIITSLTLGPLSCLLLMLFWWSDA
jgi:hypothetical protein